MSLLKTAFTSAAFLGAGLFAMSPSDADAQIRVQIGGGGYGYNNGYGYNRGFNNGYRSNNYGYRSNRYDGHSGHRHGTGYRGTRAWHDTSHYDYHPTTIVPHGNHYHVQPGHYDYHRTGHYDTYRGSSHYGHGH